MWGAFAIAAACHTEPAPTGRAPLDGTRNAPSSARLEDPLAVPARPEHTAMAAIASRDAALRLVASSLPVDDDPQSPLPPEADDPMDLHQTTREGLLALFALRPMSNAENQRILPAVFLRASFGPHSPATMNQGNRAIANHQISKKQCLAGLTGITLQTPEQHATCGAENMVPVWLSGQAPWFCIDVFEFPNRPCELPVVWAPPTRAKTVCELQGKRLCSQVEWNLACRGDPAGAHDSHYAYGNRLDLSLCNTHKGHRRACDAHNAMTAWNTCATETEPSGSFPGCRSRFGVFDQHGNVAEVMMRREGDAIVSQLKGSAWFYDELAREPDAPVPSSTPDNAGAYPDHCNFDPRWHVEDIKNAWHVNYHLGFRCCKSIP